MPGSRASRPPRRRLKIAAPPPGLAPWAASELTSRGRLVAEPRHAYRSEYQRDRDRIIHCTAFRRLVYKTQVFVNHEGDLYRTRLTHSLEVAQIARTVAGRLGLNEQLTEAICLAHDLGHTPFGHAGQDALDHCMKPWGGFEHNLQSLRVVDELEERYLAFPGLNLTFETREGILKHCSRKNARELGELGERFLKRQQPGLEAQLANLADEIGYNNHDLDDGLRAGLLTPEDLAKVSLFEEHYRPLARLRRRAGSRVLVSEAVRQMINFIVTDLIDTTARNIAKAHPRTIEEVRGLSMPLVGFSRPAAARHNELKKFLRQRLYRHRRVLAMTSRARAVVEGLFACYMADPAEMPKEHAGRAARQEAALGRAGRARAVADYVAGMTDRYAISAYRRLVDPRLDW